MFDLVPADRHEFAAEMTPCLALVTGVGMSREDRREWLNAAYRALDGIPADLLRRGAAAAMRTADHPSKIVPAIMAEVSEGWAFRRRHGGPRAAAPPPPPPSVQIEDNSPLPLDEVRAILNAPGGSEFAKIGLGKGWITQAQIDAIRQTQAEAA